MLVQKNIVETIKENIALIIRPKQQWIKVINDKRKEQGVFLNLFFPGLILILVTVLLGSFLFESTYGFLFKYAVIKSVRAVLLVFTTFITSTLILYEVSRWYKVPIDFETSRRLVVYSMLPYVFITIICGLFPFLTFLRLASFYSFYLLYSGLVTIYNINPYRKIAYLSVLFISMLLAFILVSYFLSLLTALIVY